MTSTNEKALIVERIAIKVLRQQGYAIHHTIRTPYFYRGQWGSNANDLLGCIDILALKPGERIRFIQCTAGRDVGRKKRDLAEVPWDPMHASVEIWRWIDGSGKRMDGRNGKPRARMYFQVYRLDRGFELDKSDRIIPESS
ncbi:MAG TPA: hypothetical protein VM286_08740 [Candidatus Thermoplasmatota archaeon]|nr:hypothetical protein [Candidatus Thermoplasmatota archaeon]